MNHRPSHLAGFSHGVLDVSNEVRLHYVMGGSGTPLVLIHGFPQTWYSWRRVMPLLAAHHQVIAVDLRGAGYSDCSVASFSKREMAEDLEALRLHLRVERCNVAGHDIGGGVAFAWAAHHPESVAKLLLVDTVIPGGSVWDGLLADARMWHINFHAAPGVAEMLVHGREREYLQVFFRQHAYNQGAFTAEDIEEFGNAYARPGAIRNAAGWYRALSADAAANRVFMAKKLQLPVVTIGGDHSLGPLMSSMALEFAHDVQSHIMERCGHWLAEEDPAAFVALMRHSLDENASRPFT
ncbi:MAG: alpha/beta hydrolase [Steroidobacteraceae bacterium]